MRLTLTIRHTDAANGMTERDIRVTAPKAATVRAVRPDVLAAVGAPAHSPLSVAGRAIGDDAVLGAVPLVNGAVIDVGYRPSEAVLRSSGAVEVHVIGGPLAGTVLPLRAGSTVVGRSPNSGIVLAESDVSRGHAEITVTSGQVFIRDLGSTNGTRLNAVPIGQAPEPLLPEDVVEIGESILTVPGPPQRMASTAARFDGTRGVRRMPRIRPPFAAQIVDLPARPATPRPAPVQWLAALAPALAGVAFSWLTHNPDFLIFALLSPLVMLGQSAGDRVSWRRTRRRQLRERADAERAARRRAAVLMAEEARWLHREHPDPVVVAQTAQLPGERLWERDRSAPDPFSVRIGLGPRPSTVALRREQEVSPAGTLPAAPVLADLAVGPLGLTGPRAAVLAVARWVICQLAVAHSPADLRIAAITASPAPVETGEAARLPPEWQFLRWLPHVAWPPEPTESAAGNFGSLSELLSDAERQAQDRGDRPWTVFILDERAGYLPAVDRLIRLGPSARCTAIAIATERSMLPAGCHTLARIRGETATRLEVATAGCAPLQPAAATFAEADAVADQVSERWADRVARALAGLSDIRVGAEAALPANVRLLDLLQLADPTPAEVVSRWARGAAPATVVGVCARGPVSIDLVADGPHALIAGTTGAGKSELLQSLIAGLALALPPTALNFILIDYKGGAAFAECARLPHTVALATDLDSHLTQRALSSLEAELRRRETLLAAAGVSALDDLAGRADGAQLVRLVIVVDEFAALAQELPDFVQGLISIAQRGRSLGLHLVLATQRPGGVVSPEIRANTALRICLRVTDPGESADVVGTDTAARIPKSTPGRAVFRMGCDVLVAQTARITNQTPLADETVAVEVLDGRRRIEVDTAPPDGNTDLQLLVAAVREAAARLELPAPASPWLAPLPPVLPVRAAGPGASVVFAVADLPDQQRRRELAFDLSEAAPLLVVGCPGSGKTSALRAIAASAASVVPPDELHLYVLDFGGGTLRSLACLPHCGAVLTGVEMSTVVALLEYLAGEPDGQRRSATVVLLIDGWEAFQAASDDHDRGRSVDLVSTLLRDGRTMGVTVLVTGDRGTLAGRLPRLIERRIALRLADPGDYTLAGIPTRSVPARMPPGRGLLWGSTVEIQLGVLGADGGLDAQDRTVRAIAAHSPAPARTAPRRFVALPRHVHLSDLQSDSIPHQVILGAGGTEAATVVVDLAPGRCLLVAGGARSGRSTLLASILQQVAATRPCLVIGPGRSPLHRLARAIGASSILPDVPPSEVHPPDGAILLVDDAAALADSPWESALTERLRRPSSGLSMVVTARTEDLAVSYRGLAFELRRSGQLLLLRPNPGDAELLGLKTGPRYSSWPPGRGLAVLHDLLVSGPTEELFEIQLAAP